MCPQNQHITYGNLALITLQSNIWSVNTRPFRSHGQYLQSRIDTETYIQEYVLLILSYNMGTVCKRPETNKQTDTTSSSISLKNNSKTYYNRKLYT
jgi:hypothetical protein